MSYSKQTRHCSFCGSVVEPEAVFCPNCGAALTPTEKTTSYTPSVETPYEPPPYEPAPPPPPADPQSYQYGAEAGYEQTYYQQPPYRSESSLGTISLVFGILGFVCLPFIGSIIAIITGFMGKDTSSDSQAKAGIILGFIGCCWPLIFLPFSLFWW